MKGGISGNHIRKNVASADINSLFFLCFVLFTPNMQDFILNLNQLFQTLFTLRSSYHKACRKTDRKPQSRKLF